MSTLSSKLVNTAAEIDGASLLAHCLYEQHARIVFGVVGIPVVEIAEAIQEHPDMRFYCCRNEQVR
jgi:2-hydroxyacyl-CoA lyase 1